MSDHKASSTVSLNSSHWGVFAPVVAGGRVVATEPFFRDGDPSDIIRSIPDAVHHRSRVTQPAVREGWLREGPGAASDGRGGDRFIPVTWERVLDLITAELKRVIAAHGNEAIFGGSYGWSSAGRFHHAKSQLSRFLSLIGGFVNSRDSYSTAAGSVLLKHVVGDSTATSGGSSWQTIADHAQLVVMFGGIPVRNTQVTPGGVGEHTTRRWLQAAKANGLRPAPIRTLR
ncbi:MAG: molybdopterin-dependent oxidoreductase [Candidatus Binataceae bacterium]